ncbi:CRISPR system Cascade subunit CasA [Streptosporangium becharense]|uniref:CRISPR system Cascade subunit CasA n=1 Tax=Streptosporangium becharense TaxID=1816182 RepID=A0A7W9IM57_9ACTN|nr:type I-E CRISPR-associated protein Cse1/CasA [Streptosporangium becharense]MBB2910398.1 CRISPR system Cascade subunit CasA [Streptosporangium becharense]MBB5823141.1 CRISPR system Cascade subunit CasA [Streptosporangium becharense]
MLSEPAAPSFDLTCNRWLPVQRQDGTEDELSLRQLFVQAGDLRRLVGDVPTQEFALLRLLLAIVHDAVDGPRDLGEWQELWENGLPAGRIAEYLDCHRERFDLLHPREPFFQTAGLRTATGEVGSLDRIIADVPNGMPFFTMRARGAERLGFAEAARWLVHAHAFDTSGIKTGALGDPRVKGGKVYPQGVAWAGALGGVLVEGENLRETLLLNLIAFDTDNLRVDPENDLPAWRRPPPGPTQADPVELSRRPRGIRDLYTWQSRRVRLTYDAEGVNGVILAYGDPLTPHNKHQREPMTSWRRSSTQEKKLGLAQVYLPREHDPSRSAWRGLGALIAGRAERAEQRDEAAAVVRPRILDWVARLTVEGDLPSDFLIRARLFGAVYGTQQSVIDEIIDDAVAMPVVLLHERDSGLGQAAIDAVRDAEGAVTVLGDLAADLARAAGAQTDPPRTTARGLGFGTLDGAFRDWLAGIRPGDAPQTQRSAWQRQAHRIVSRLGDQLLRSAGDAAWEGRVIKAQGQELWLTASRADWMFRTRLRKALPATAVDDPQHRDQDDGSGQQNVEVRS